MVKSREPKKRVGAVALYDSLTAYPEKVVMTGSLAIDPKAWSATGHITTVNAWIAAMVRDLVKDVCNNFGVDWT